MDGLEPAVCVPHDRLDQVHVTVRLDGLGGGRPPHDVPPPILLAHAPSGVGEVEAHLRVVKVNGWWCLSAPPLG
jgi:hypothetical protein